MAIAPLAVAETLFWAAYYYSFPGLLPAWEADLGWSRSEIAGAFTAALVLTGVLAPQAGRLIDRGHARTTFVGAAIVGAVLLILLSFVDQLWHFWTIWLAMGIVNAACLYEACFAIITVTTGQKARKAITVTTLYAGFAGTISFPTAFALTELLGWRGTVMVFGATMLLIAIPLALLGFRWMEAHRAPAAETPETTGREGRQVLGNPVFWFVGLGFTTIGIVHGMVISHIRPMLDDRGVDVAVAVFIASMFGPMQVFGRVIIVMVGARLTVIVQALCSFIGITLGLALLYLAREEPLLALVFVVPYGAAYGVVSIIRPVLAAEYLGRAGFGVVSGMLGAPYMLGFAAGPTLAALVWSAVGYDVVIAMGLCLTILGGGMIYLAKRAAQRRGP
ncbi:MAG: MFS transporter [Pseudomonadota bacterium]